MRTRCKLERPYAQVFAAHILLIRTLCCCLHMTSACPAGTACKVLLQLTRSL